MRKFTNKQAAKIEQWLDEAFNDGYKAAELDAKFLFTAEANMKRAEAEFNKREEVKVPEEWKAQSDGALEAKAAREAEFNKRNEQSIEQRVQEQLGHPLYGKPAVIVFMDYGTPDELYKSEDMTDELFSFWGEQ